MVGSRDLEWIQGALNVLIRLFRWYRLLANVAKYKAMTCQMGTRWSGISDESVVWWCVGRGTTYQEHLIRQTPCLKFVVELATGLMKEHKQFMNGVEPEIDCNLLPVSQTEQISQVFDVSFLMGTSHWPSPFPDCTGSSRTWNFLRNYFNCQQWGYILWILEKHPTPFPKYKRYGSQVPPRCLENRHYEIDKFQLG